MTQDILAPVMALVLWTLVMWVWLYATRIPAMRKARTRLEPRLPRDQLLGGLPPEVRWKADNYNHLMEQPTLFYATALTLAVIGDADPINVWLAWAYVGLRILHSLIQATANVVRWRFLLFSLASLCLLGLTVHAAAALLCTL